MKDLISLIIFMVSLLILYKTTNHLCSLLIILFIAISYIIKHYKLNIFLKKELTNQVNILERLFNASSDVIVYLDLNLNIITYNESLLKIFNPQKAKVKGCSLKTLVKLNTNDYHRYNQIWTKLEKMIKESIVTRQSITSYETYYLGNAKAAQYYNISIFPTINTSNEIHGIVLIARDVTAEYGAKLIAIEREKQLQCILENLPLRAYLKDKNDNFIVGSTSFGEITNCHDNLDVKQLQLSDVYDENYIKIIKEEEANIYKNKQIISVERQVVLPKESFWGRIRKVPVFDSNGDVRYLVVMYENIEAEKEKEKQKQYFIETLIHDLKIPTLAQLRALEIMQTPILGSLNKDQKEITLEIQRSCNTILKMISMVSNTYRIENGQKRLFFEDFSMSDLLIEIFRELSPMAQEKNITFLFSSCENTRVTADKSEIKNVIVSLISNAIIYSNPSENIDIRLLAENNYLKFSIYSKGIVFSEQEKEILYNKLGSDEHSKYTTIGLGIALYLSKQIVDAHEGHIYINNKKNEINSLTFEIPQVRHQRNPETSTPLFI